MAHQDDTGRSAAAIRAPSEWLTRAWLPAELFAALAAILVASALMWWSAPLPSTLDAEPSFRLPSGAVLERPATAPAETDDEAVKTGSFAFPAPPCRVVSTDPLILNSVGQSGEGQRAGMDDEQQVVLAAIMERRMQAADAALAAKAAADPGTPTDHPLRWSDEFFPSEMRGFQRPGGAATDALGCDNMRPSLAAFDCRVAHPCLLLCSEWPA